MEVLQHVHVAIEPCLGMEEHLERRPSGRPISGARSRIDARKSGSIAPMSASGHRIENDAQSGPSGGTQASDTMIGTRPAAIVSSRRRIDEVPTPRVDRARTEIGRAPPRIAADDLRSSGSMDRRRRNRLAPTPPAHQHVLGGRRSHPDNGACADRRMNRAGRAPHRQSTRRRAGATAPPVGSRTPRSATRSETPPEVADVQPGETTPRPVALVIDVATVRKLFDRREPRTLLRVQSQPTRWQSTKRMTSASSGSSTSSWCVECAPTSRTERMHDTSSGRPIDPR